MNKLLITMALAVVAFLGTSTVTAQTVGLGLPANGIEIAACIPPGGVATGTFPFGVGNDSLTCLNSLKAMCCSGLAASGGCNCVGNPLPNTCVGSVTCGGTAVVATPSVVGAGGMISPSTPVTTAAGQTVVFTLTPNVARRAAVAGTCGGNLVGNIFTTNLITANCTVIATFPDVGCLDVDGNGVVDPLTDGLMLLRAMFGLTGTSVTNSAIGTGTPSRTTWTTIRTFLNANCGMNFAP